MAAKVYEYKHCKDCGAGFNARGYPKEVAAWQFCERCTSRHKEKKITPMDKESAQDLLERKCLEQSCWHRPSQGYLYCICCINGKCATIPAAKRRAYLKAMEVLEGREYV